MRILSLGGTRFIGAAAVRALVDRGHTIACFHRGQTPGDLPASIQRIHGDFARLEEHLEAFTAFAPTLILDMRPMVKAHADRVLRLAESLDVPRVVAISSCDVYRSYGILLRRETGAIDNTPALEGGPLRTALYPMRGMAPDHPDDPERWRRDYDKIPVEQAVLGHAQIAGTVLRLPMVYGPGDFRHRFAPWLRRMVDGRSAIVLGARMARWRGARGYIDDVGEGIALAIDDERAAGRIYNVAEADAPTEREWLEAVAQIAGWSGQIIEVDEDELPEAWAPGMEIQQHLLIDTTRIRGELGYRERFTRQEALKRTIDWERDHLPDGPPMPPYDVEDAVLARLESRLRAR